MICMTYGWLIFLCGMSICVVYFIQDVASVVLLGKKDSTIDILGKFLFFLGSLALIAWFVDYLRINLI